MAGGILGVPRRVGIHEHRIRPLRARRTGLVGRRSETWIPIRVEAWTLSNEKSRLRRAEEKRDRRKEMTLLTGYDNENNIFIYYYDFFY